MTWNPIYGERWGHCSRGLVPAGKKKCGDQKIATGREECDADGNQRMTGVDGKEHAVVGDQTDTIDLGLSEMCKRSSL